MIIQVICWKLHDPFLHLTGSVLVIGIHNPSNQLEQPTGSSISLPHTVSGRNASVVLLFNIFT